MKKITDLILKYWLYVLFVIVIVLFALTDRFVKGACTVGFFWIAWGIYGRLNKKV